MHGYEYQKTFDVLTTEHLRHVQTVTICNPDFRC